MRAYDIISKVDGYRIMKTYREKVGYPHTYEDAIACRPRQV